jgi:hypothetical protein
MKIWFDENGNEAARPQHAYGAYNITDERLMDHGWSHAEAPDAPRKYWVIDNRTVREMTQPEKDAVDAAEQAAHEAAETARGIEVAGQSAEAVTTLATLLEAFGLYMPLDFADAMGVMYTHSKQVADKTPDALLALITYQGLREHYTDRDIYLAAKHLGLTQEPEA